MAARPTFQQRHYEACAEVFRKSLDGALNEEVAGIGYAITGMANMFAADNPNFNHVLWYNACYADREDLSPIG